MQSHGMNRKADKVEETAAAYAAKSAEKASAGSKSAGSANDAAFKKAAEKIFSERKELLHKLAQ